MTIIIGITGLVLTVCSILLSLVHAKRLYHGWTTKSEQAEELVKTSATFRYKIHISVLLSILLACTATTILWLGFSLPWLHGGSLFFVLISLWSAIGIYSELAPRILLLFK